MKKRKLSMAALLAMLMTLGCVPDVDNECQRDSQCQAGEICHPSGVCAPPGPDPGRGDVGTRPDGHTGAVDGAGGNPNPDSGPDATPDAQPREDAGPDQGAGGNPNPDSGPDATPDAQPREDAGPDMGTGGNPNPDSGPDATPDATPSDASPDQGPNCDPMPEECNGEDDDCDRVIDDGFDLQNDIENCGECGNACSFPNGLALCQRGECVFIGCSDQDHFDLDGESDNGCEYACRLTGQVDLTCNGIDDDCDSEVDDEVAPQGTTCGVGACQAVGTVTCEDGEEVSTCQPGPPVAADDTSCNDIDDDCDEGIDEDFVPAMVVCGVGACRREALTLCREGEQDNNCQPGMPAVEVCNEIDDDCDGAADEDVVNCTCEENAMRECGRCPGNKGIQICEDGMTWGPCMGALEPRLEICNGADDDCDGDVDEDIAAVECLTGLAGACRWGTESCQDGRLTCRPNTPPEPEVCDGLDNDCDSTIDNNVAAVECDTGDPGPCAAGTTGCIEAEQVCVSAHQPTPEICNTQDDDCDGTVDEESAGTDAPCSNNLPGVCARDGRTTCREGNIVCNAPRVEGTPETCNGSDDDCDGTVDDAAPCGPGEVCRGGLCQAGCDPHPELCNDEDDDCDGVTDEACGVAIPAGDVINRMGELEPLGAFVVGQTEVTAEAYDACVATGRCSAPLQGPGYTSGDPAKTNHPINGVTWQQARTFCQAAGGDLPNVSQWMRAARGDTNNPYPWGMEPVACDRAQIGICVPMGTRAVGELPAGASIPFGLADMAGNVEEWTLNPQGANRLVGGGSWRKLPQDAGLQVNEFIARPPGDGSDTIGFRCVYPSPR